ncbi:MAG TPA: M23 family metallopeptidase [Patescibacteria group bacterium]|nr:M23 family metallopeptidase [Patescibacteria group bacterium]
MKKEILLATLFFTACQQAVNSNVSISNNENDPKLLAPAPLPTFTPEPTHVWTPTPIPTEIQTDFVSHLNDVLTLPTETDPIADSCILPFEGATMNHGLQFMMPIVDDYDKQKTDKNGNTLWHLGLDFSGNKEEGGEEVVSMCDGIVLFAGNVHEVPQTSETKQNLGNVVAVETTFLDDNGEVQKGVMVYAHLEDVTNFEEGTIIKKGTRLGLLGKSGNWEHAHLHVHMWLKSTWDAILYNKTINGNLRKMAGLYPDNENTGNLLNWFIDIKKFLLSKLIK